MVRFEPPSKPVTLAPATEQRQIKSELIQLKRWAGMDHFLMRGLGKCRGEFSLMTLSYNFKRVMNELGGAAFTEHCLEKQRLEAFGV